MEDDDAKPDDDPPPEHVSGIRPYVREAVALLCCALVCVLGVWIAGVVIISVLLYNADTPDVHHYCEGYWDFMLAALLAPVMLPLGYCLVVCLWGMTWRAFSGASMGMLAVMLLWMTTVSGTNAACVEAIRATSPPLPWLLVLGWLKAAAYGAASWSQLRETQ